MQKNAVKDLFEHTKAMGSFGLLIGMIIAPFFFLVFGIVAFITKHPAWGIASLGLSGFFVYIWNQLLTNLDDLDPDGEDYQDPFMR